MTVPMCGNTQQDVCVNPMDFQLEVRVTMETQTFEFYCTGQNEHGSATTTTVNVTRAQGTYVCMSMICIVLTRLYIGIVQPMIPKPLRTLSSALVCLYVCL